MTLTLTSKENARLLLNPPKLFLPKSILTSFEASSIDHLSSGTIKTHLIKRHFRTQPKVMVKKDILRIFNLLKDSLQKIAIDKQKKDESDKIHGAEVSRIILQLEQFQDLLVETAKYSPKKKNILLTNRIFEGFEGILIAYIKFTRNELNFKKFNNDVNFDFENLDKLEKLISSPFSQFIFQLMDFDLSELLLRSCPKLIDFYIVNSREAEKSEDFVKESVELARIEENSASNVQREIRRLSFLLLKEQLKSKNLIQFNVGELRNPKSETFRAILTLFVVKIGSLIVVGAKDGSEFEDTLIKGTWSQMAKILIYPHGNLIESLKTQWENKGKKLIKEGNLFIQQLNELNKSLSLIYEKIQSLGNKNGGNDNLTVEILVLLKAVLVSDNHLIVQARKNNEKLFDELMNTVERLFPAEESMPELIEVDEFDKEACESREIKINQKPKKM